AKPAYCPGEKGWPQRRGTAWASGAMFELRTRDRWYQSRADLFHSVLHLQEKGGGESRYPHITKYGVGKGGNVERQVAASRAAWASGRVRGRTLSWVGEDVTPQMNGVSYGGQWRWWMDQDADRKASEKVVAWARLCPLRCQAG
ncbi:hypothetical protein HAX54_008784, partial [Datura stramonium]|nr:hypothetical protein [Datura stramonium]